jgi:GcrA cell cycle regulator
MESGRSYQEAAADLSALFGTEITKGACVGRGIGLGLQSKHSRGNAARNWNVAQRIAKIQTDPVMAPADYAPPVLRCVEIEPLNLTFMELERGQCKFPYGDGPIVHCGHPALTGRPYCGPHTAIATKVVNLA